MSWKKWHKKDGYYINDEKFIYYSKRYKKYVTVPEGFISDGATGARDVDSKGWWVHDVLCVDGFFDDGSECTNWQASSILGDILKDEGYWFRGRSWFIATWFMGGGKARDNGMW
tara:strand:- start:876 stop:1217 length:342 start_codon:yes stop_codon:yes gene_type:complete